MNLLINLSAASRILKSLLGGIFKRVESIRQLNKNLIQVTYKTIFGRCSTFISAIAFKQNFVNFRKASANGLRVIQGTTRKAFYVVNPVKSTTYNLLLFSDGIDCDCKDYEMQIGQFKKGCCKHGYAVLNYLGFDSLKKYIQTYKT